LLIGSRGPKRRCSSAVTRQYYKALPDRLKDEIARIGKPTDLHDLQDLVATLDQRYWERQSEISHDRKPVSTNNNSKSSDNRTDNQPREQLAGQWLEVEQPTAGKAQGSEEALLVKQLDFFFFL
jgi:hypothetical protein